MSGLMIAVSQVALIYSVAPFLDKELLFGSCRKELANRRRKLVQAMRGGGVECL